jgi:cation:H+ antiporter
MAVASLLGSNLFNIVILSITDFCYVKGPLLRSVSQVNTLAALTAMIAMAIVVIGLTYRPQKKILFIGGDAAAIILVCLLANVLLFIAH